MTVSLTSSKDKETIFGTIFFIIWVGGFVVTLNAKFLGGKVSIFQSVCVLGYCVFPINIVSILTLFLKSIIPFLVRVLIVTLGFMWSTKASV